MRKLVALSVLLLWFVGIGCEQKQRVDHLKAGRMKLLNSGLALEAVEPLKIAVTEEYDKTEPRILLILAYSHALSSGSAKLHGLESEFILQRKQRLEALGDAEMEGLLNLLVQRSRVQKDAMQVLIDKGASAVPLLINALGKVQYENTRVDIIEMLYTIGPDALNLIIAAISNPTTSAPVKISLVRLIGSIGEVRGIADLEALGESMTDAGLKMEINAALYKLGRSDYKSEILKGLRASEVNVRRAAAKAIIDFEDNQRSDVIKALQDTDDRVREYASQALQKRPDKNAVQPLVEVLKSDADNVAKQAALEALKIHVARGLARKLAVDLIRKELLGGKISDADDRLRIVQLLREEELVRQIEAAPVELQLKYDLDQYRQKEEHGLVKRELGRLLETLR